MWDVAFMLSALWLTPLVWSLSEGDGHANDSAALVVYVVLTAGFWIGHRLSSSYLAWCTMAYRPLLRSQRTRFVRVPLAIVIVVFAFLIPGDDALPWTRAQRVLLLGSIDAVFIVWHFAAQHFGILSLYRLRCGPAGTALKRADRAFALGVGGVVIVVAEVLAGTAFLQDRWLNASTGAWLATWHEPLQWLLSWVVVGATAAIIVVDSRAGLSRARVLAFLNLATMALLAVWAEPFVFLVVWTSQHWLASVGLTTVVGSVDDGGHETPPSRWYRGWRTISGARLLPFLIIVSVLLFPLMEVEAVGDAERLSALLPWLTSTMAELLSSSSLALPVLVAVGFATAFVHYHLDRAVFRFSDPEVRSAARGAL